MEYLSIAVYLLAMVYLLKRKSCLYRPGLLVGAFAIVGLALNSELVTSILTAMRAV